MIQHIVLVKWKPDTTDAQINTAFENAQELVTGIEHVERVTLGRNRGDSSHGFTHALIVKLSDDSALPAYLEHPVRQRYLTEALEPIVADRIEIDIPEDAHHDRPSAHSSWDWNGPRVSAAAAAAALRWEETHPDD